MISMLANVSKSLIKAEAKNRKIPERRIETGGWGRNRTGVNGVADRGITTLPPSPGEERAQVYRNPTCFS